MVKDELFLVFKMCCTQQFYKFVFALASAKQKKYLERTSSHNYMMYSIDLELVFTGFSCSNLYQFVNIWDFKASLLILHRRLVQSRAPGVLFHYNLRRLFIQYLCGFIATGFKTHKKMFMMFFNMSHWQFK